jgi:predicted RNA-binding protein YlqC (UPF0109 family)
MTDKELKTLQALLVDVAARFLKHADKIEVRHQAGPGTCFWMMRVDQKDEPKAVGTEGCHARAFAALVAAWGRRYGEVHTFRLITGPRTKQPREQFRDLMEYDPQPEVQLLHAALSHCSISGFRISTEPPDHPVDTLTFRFEIGVLTSADYSLLVGPGPEGTEPLIGSIGTLFRAMARKIGVAFEFTVVEPKLARV